jgi:mannose-6-phosphate isomerase-like protein (cupin superfamily)
MRPAPKRRVVLKAGRETFRSPRTGASLRIAVAPEPGAPDVLSVERVLKPGMGRLPEHVHLDFAERFKVRQGIAEAQIAGDTVRLSAGKKWSTLYVPPGVPHVNPYNADPASDLVVRQVFEPASEGARSYIETLAQVLWDGRDDNGEMPWSLVLAVADATRDRTYFTGVPLPGKRRLPAPFTLQRRVLLPLGTLLAGTRDYAVYLTREPPQRRPARK